MLLDEVPVKGMSWFTKKRHSKPYLLLNAFIAEVNYGIRLWQLYVYARSLNKGRRIKPILLQYFNGKRSKLNEEMGFSRRYNAQFKWTSLQSDDVRLLSAGGWSSCWWVVLLLVGGYAPLKQSPRSLQLHAAGNSLLIIQLQGENIINFQVVNTTKSDEHTEKCSVKLIC
jgi:hypothetical protein